MLSLIVAFGYFLIFFVMVYGLARTSKISPSENHQTASIIICGRNEANRITPLLESLAKINYPDNQYEILLVNDDSTDNTGALMRAFCDQKDNRHYLVHKKTGQSYKGKKGALNFGIQQAKYDIILATDADCIVQANWVRSMLGYFDENTALVQGYSPVKKRSDFLSVYQQFDTLAEGVTAAASMYFNNPTHANARNFAFRKSVYNEVGGFSRISHVDTGDDFYLAKLIKTETEYDFRYNPEPSAFVFTEEVSNLKTYWHQQLRRNSKGFDLGWQFLLLGGWLLLFHLLLISLLIAGQWSLFGLLLGGKFIAEFIPVLIGAIKFKEFRVLPFFPVLWLLYPLFYFSSQILGSFKFYRWK